MTNTCSNCGNEIKAHSLEVAGRVIVLPVAKYCSRDECTVVARSLQDEENPKLAIDVLDSCPELFRDTDPNRLSGSLCAHAKSWDPFSGQGRRTGLIIHGATRKGKSRCMWYIRNRLVSRGVKVRVFTMFELEAEMASAWGKEKWDVFMRELTEVQLLCLDDLGKEKMTERMASVLFALIDQRTQHNRPTLITTNHTSQSLMDRFHDKEIGSAFVARLKEKDMFVTIAAAAGVDTPEML